MLHVLEIAERHFVSKIWRQSNEADVHFSEAKKLAIEELRLTEADDLMYVLQQYGPDWFYVIQTNVDGEWHTVAHLDDAIGARLTERSVRRELARKRAQA